MPDENPGKFLVLDEDAKHKVLKALQENNQQLSFLYTLIARDECTPDSVKTHLALFRHHFNNLSALLDGGETLFKELDDMQQDLRTANQRIRDLEAQMGAQLTAVAAGSRIRAITNMFYTWLSLRGFHYARIEHTDFGIRAKISSEIETEYSSEYERLDVTFGDKGMAIEIGSLVPHAFAPASGWDVFSDKSTRTYLENTDNNRDKLYELFRDFPAIKAHQLIKETLDTPINGFASRREGAHYDLSTDVFLSYECVEKWYNGLLEKKRPGSGHKTSDAKA